jgi:hypothetical protein
MPGPRGRTRHQSPRLFSVRKGARKRRKRSEIPHRDEMGSNSDQSQNYRPCKDSTLTGTYTLQSHNPKTPGTGFGTDAVPIPKLLVVLGLGLRDSLGGFGTGIWARFPKAKPTSRTQVSWRDSVLNFSPKTQHSSSRSPGPSKRAISRARRSSEWPHSFCGCWHGPRPDPERPPLPERR